MRIATLGDVHAVHTRRWVAALRERGHEVRVWSLESPPAGFAVEALPRAPLPGFARYPLALPALRRALREFAPDLVDAHYVPNYGLLGALAGRRPLVVTAWGSDLLVAGRRGGLQRVRAGYVLRRADLVLTDAQNLAAAARALGAPAGRIHVVPWGVDLERFRPEADREPGLVVSARRHEGIYDIETILRAMSLVLARDPRTRLVVIGEGSRRAALEKQAAALLPPGRWTFTGSLAAPEFARWLARAQVYVSASRSDSTSVSLLEAMAAGALPVVSDIPGNREWVQEGEGARLFPCGDADALARAVERALGDPAWAAAARARNRALVERRADWRRTVPCIEALYAGLLEAAGRGRSA